MVGAVVMTHGDEKGLRLPPRLAPIQVVIVPIFRSDDEQATVMDAVQTLKRALVDADIRVQVDTREYQPGFKFNDWEMRGVPVRLEIGPRDVAGGTVVAARRDMPGKEGKRFLKQENIAPQVRALLDEIQANMLAQATTFRDANTFDVHSYDEFRGVMEQGGFARVWWAGDAADLAKIKGETAATHRCTPLDQPGGTGTCFYTGKPAENVAIFARAY
jgi:prolyl-tRNA synthetase